MRDRKPLSPADFLPYAQDIAAALPHSSTLTPHQIATWLTQIADGTISPHDHATCAAALLLFSDAQR